VVGGFGHIEHGVIYVRIAQLEPEPVQVVEESTCLVFFHI